MAEFRLSHHARLNITSIHSFVAAQSALSADRLVDRFFDAFALLADNPEIGPAWPELADGIRKWVVGNYVVLYRALPNVVEIAAVVHGAMDVEAIFRTGRGR